jgi:hypothetical protein
MGVGVSVGGAIDERDGAHCIRIAPQLPDNYRAGNLGDPKQLSDSYIKSKASNALCPRVDAPLPPSNIPR